MEAWAVGADKDTHDDGATGQTEAHGVAQPHVDGNAPQKEAQDNAQEDGHHVGLVQVFDGVTQFVGHMLDAVGLADDGDAVAHAQDEVGRGDELYAGALYAADVDAVAVAEL